MPREARDNRPSPRVERQREEKMAEVISFSEAAKKVHARRLKEKILHEAVDRYGEMEPNDPRVALLQRAYERLIKVMPDVRHGNANFLASPDINAFAIRTQSDVFMHDGLLRGYVRWCERNGETPSEDAFAFVVAHELGHIRQGTEEIDASEDGHDDGKHKKDKGEEKREHQQHLNNEYDADRFGLQAIARAGYNPREGLKMLKFLQSLSDGISLPTTHPRSDDRLRELVALVESPDTIIQNTDTPPTALEAEFAKELAQEDAQRPGTALYRGAAKERLGDFILSSETMSDALEVVQVAEMHRYLTEINRLRQVESIRTAYAKQVVADNIRQVIEGLDRAYTGGGMKSFSLVVSSSDLPTNATRYTMREYGYDKVKEEPDLEAEKFDADITAGFTENLTGQVKYLNDIIRNRLAAIARETAKLSPGSPGLVRFAAYQEKLESLRDHLVPTLDSVDHTALGHIVTNAEVDAKKDWFDDTNTHTWLRHTSVDDVLAWCKSNGTALFSQLVHPFDEKMRAAVGDVAAVDSRYQSNLPPEMLAQENFFTQEGRAAFLEQSLFVHAEKSFKWRAGNSREFDGCLERTKDIPAQLKLQLSAKLEGRYAFMKDSRRLAEAMANAILSDDYSAQYDVQDILRRITPDEARAWVATVEPVWVSYRSSANALFLAETGIHGKAVDNKMPNAYEKFYRLEAQCAEAVRKALGTEGSKVNMDELTRAVALGDEHVRREAVGKIAESLREQKWTSANVDELDQRLSPILQELKPDERRSILFRVLGSGREKIPNLPAVIEYAVDACPDYAQGLLRTEWKQLIESISEEERLRIFKKVYGNASGFSDLSPHSWNKDFINKIGSEYINSSVALHGEDAFAVAVAELAGGDFAYGKLGEPLFANEDIQRKLEALSDQRILQIARSCKEADAAGKIYDAMHNSFTAYITRRVLEAHGVQGFDSREVWNCKFDTNRPFEEVFAGIGEHVMPYYAEIMLEQCMKAYGKTPGDVVIAGLEHHYKPIPTSVVRTGKSFEGADRGRWSVDDYADIYNPKARPFYEQRDYVSSRKREAIEEFINGSGFLRDRSKTAAERMNIVTELIPEKTDYRDVLFGEIEQDFLAENNIKTEGHRLVMDTGADGKVAAVLAYTLYTTALPEMVDQARMQLWGRRADALYREYLGGDPESLSDELARIQQLFPQASFARDEALYALGNTTLVKTPEQARQVQGLLSEMQRQTSDVNDLSSQSQLERFNVFMGNLSRTEKKDFILWTIGAAHAPPKSLRAYGGLNSVSVEDVPAFVFAATQQEREQFLLRMFVGSNGLFEPQNPEDEKVLDEFIGHAFDRIFPNDEAEGVTGEPREMLRTVFATVLTEYDSYRRGKIFTGMLESMRGQKSGGRGEKIATLMNELGPVFVKVGQVLSETEKAPGEYLLPEDIRTSMKKLKQSAKRFHRMAAVFSLETANEFGKDNPHQIAYVGDTLAAASIKQVNAVVRVDGREAVEKVLRPSIEKHLQEDVRVLGKIVERMRAITAVPRGIEEVGATYVQEEADFVREVSNTKKIDKALRNYKKSAVVRKMPVRTTEVYSYSKTHIQEEKVRGLSLEELTRLAENPSSLEVLAKKHGLTDTEQQTYSSLASKVGDVRLQAFDALAYQYFQADAFHSDPHAGNMFVTPEGELVLIDNGSIGQTKQTDRNNLKKFFLGFALKQPTELRTAVKALAKGLEEQHLDAVLEIAQGQLGDADKMNQILVILTEQAKELDPAFDKFLKSFATGAYLMSGLRPDDVRMVLGAYTQGDSGSLRSYAATAVARAARENPDSLVGRAARKLIDR